MIVIDRFERGDPEYKGPWNEIHNTARVFTARVHHLYTFIFAHIGPAPPVMTRLIAGPKPFIDTKYAVPTYYGYPPRPYRVLGQMDTETHGRFSDALAAAANRASQYGADATLVLGP